MADNPNPSGLRVPQSKGSLDSQSVKDIMDAYWKQSKIQLYDDSSAQSGGAGSENIGVTGKNIPLAMLRPSANPTVDIDENGRPVAARPSRENMVQEAKSYRSIASAYRKMNGMEEDDDYPEDYAAEGGDPASFSEPPKPISRRDLSSVKRFEANYVEDMPEDDEGLLGILELAIENARANLEMLESLYAALSPK